MKKVDYKAIIQEMKDTTVERPNKANLGTLSGHAAGEPFEKSVYHHLKEKYPKAIFKQFEYLNDLYLKHPKVITVEERYALLNSPTALFLLSRGDKATRDWTPQNIFEEKQNDTADILYYAMVSDPHVTVWKETIHYINEEGKFQVTKEELQMYDYIASAAEFDSAYALGINLTPMDYKTNELGKIINERSVNYGYKDDPLMDPIQSATYFLNLLDNENKVKLEKVSEGDEVLLNIHFMEDGKTRQVKMVQPWGKDGIWIPQDDIT